MSIDSILTKLTEIKRLSHEIASELKSLKLGEKTGKKKAPVTRAEIPSADDLKREYESLYGEFVKGNRNAIASHVESKNKHYLQQF